MTPEEALEVFANSRGHAIDKENLAEFVRSLSKRISSSVLSRYRSRVLIGDVVDLCVWPLRPGTVRIESIYLAVGGLVAGVAVIESISLSEADRTDGTSVCNVSCRLIGPSTNTLFTDRGGREITISGERVRVCIEE